MAELADALDLGSSVPDVKVQVLSGAPKNDKLLLVVFYYNLFLNSFINASLSSAGMGFEKYQP